MSVKIMTKFCVVTKQILLTKRFTLKMFMASCILRSPSNDTNWSVKPKSQNESIPIIFSIIFLVDSNIEGKRPKTYYTWIALLVLPKNLAETFRILETFLFWKSLQGLIVFCFCLFFRKQKLMIALFYCFLLLLFSCEEQIFSCFLQTMLDSTHVQTGYLTAEWLIFIVWPAFSWGKIAIFPWSSYHVKFLESLHNCSSNKRVFHKAG